MHTIHKGGSADVGVGVSGSVGVVPGCVGAKAVVSPGGEIGVKTVADGGRVVNVEVTVEVAGGESAPKTTPTITKFATVLAARTATTIRRMVRRTQICFSQCIDHLYSSGLGHWSVGQNSKMPFLV